MAGVRPVPLWVLELCRPPVWASARLFLRIRFRGVDRVPRSGPVVLTPNHVSYLDPVLVNIPIHRALTYLALEPFFQIPVLGWVMRWCRALPLSEGSANDPVLRTALRVLRAGEPLVVFPEGGRSKDGTLQPFRPGACRLALAADVPVVPVAIHGAYEVWPGTRRLPRPGRVTIRYLPPLTRHDLPAGAPRRAHPELLTALVRARIAAALALGHRDGDPQ